MRQPLADAHGTAHDKPTPRPPLTPTEERARSVGGRRPDISTPGPMAPYSRTASLGSVSRTDRFHESRGGKPSVCLIAVGATTIEANSALSEVRPATVYRLLSWHDHAGAWRQCGPVGASTDEVIQSCSAVTRSRIWVSAQRGRAPWSGAARVAAARSVSAVPARWRPNAAELVCTAFGACSPSGCEVAPAAVGDFGGHRERVVDGQPRTGQLGHLRPTCPLPGSLMRPPRPIPGPATVDGDFSAHRRRRPTQTRRDRAKRLASVHPTLTSSRSATVRRPSVGTHADRV